MTVVEFDSSEPTPDPLGFCHGYSVTGFGGESVLAFPLQRLGVSPDGSGVVFEVNDQAPFFHFLSLPPDANGFFYVRSDGTGLRRLGPPSRDPSFRVGPEFGHAPYLPVDLNRIYTFAPPVAFSPDGRRIVFTDIGPGRAREDAVQIFVVDLATGKRTQATHLPAGAAPSPIPDQPDASPYFLTCCPRFVDDETVAFHTFTNPDGENSERAFAAYTVRIDGNGLKHVVGFTLPMDSRVIPSFGVAGSVGALARVAQLSDQALGPPIQPPADFPVSEIFVWFGGNRLLQLTRLHHVDTFPGSLSVGGTRAFFLTSADPLGTNPHGFCQIFSVNTLGRGMRQVTHFDLGVPLSNIVGCACPHCGIEYGYYRTLVQDPATRAIVFDTALNPLRLGRFPYDQVFAIRPDGGGLRQLTDAAGLVTDPDGALRIEMPGPFAYSAPIR